MAGARAKAPVVRLRGGGKRDVRTQFAALCWRVRNDKLQVALVTSRRTRRWVLPKGWPQDGATATEAAATEAWEEAGIEGPVQDICVGLYGYEKTIERQGPLSCMVAVFPLRAKRVHDKWPEAKERRRKWLSKKKAAARVTDPGLARIIRGFDPRALPK